MENCETMVAIDDLSRTCVGRSVRPTPLAFSERNPVATGNREAIASACGENEVAEAGANNDGPQSRMVWALAGNGVLFYDADADGDGVISETREFVFTEWDLAAKSDHTPSDGSTRFIRLANKEK